MTNTPVQPQIAQPVYVKAPSNGLATAALVLGIIGTVISFIPLVGGVGAFIGGVGIALAIAGFLVAGKRGVGKGKSIAGAILGVASIIIFFAVTAATVAAVDSAIDEIDKSIKEEEKNDTPTAVAVGKPFEHDGYEFSGAWKVKNEFGSATIEGLKAKNTHDSREVIQLTFTFVKGVEKVGEVECSAGELEPGHSAAMDCFSLDSTFPKGYTEVQVADMW